jgi:hypothetical protein
MKRYGLVLPMLLASCGTLPEPFYGDPGAEGAKLTAPPAPVLVVPTPTGAELSNSAAALYASDLANALNALDVPSIARAPTRNDWLLTTTASNAGGNVVPDYAISGPGGKIYGTQTGGPVPAPDWAQGAPAVLSAAATTDALALANKLAAINAAVQQSNPDSLANRPPRIFFGTVTGAPGDGDSALAVNMLRDLPSPQTEMVTSPAAADFSVTGVVKAQPDSNHQLLVELDWIVTDSSHRKIGQVTQLHDLSPGDIEPAWGDVAAAAATEAASGVNEVIANATLHKPGRDIAVKSGPLAGGFSLAIPPSFALPPPGLSGAQLAAAFAPPSAAPEAVAAITEPLPMPAAAAPAQLASAAPASLASAAPAPTQPNFAAPPARLPADASRPLRAPPEMLAAAAPAAVAPAAPFNPFAAAFRVAANTAVALFGRIGAVLTPAAPSAPAETAAAQVAAIQPAEAAPVPPPVPPANVVPASEAVTVQPTVLITPVQMTPLPAPAGAELVAEYGATAQITPVFAVPLAPRVRPPAARPRVAERASGQLAAFHGRFARPAPVASAAPATPAAPALAVPALAVLTPISDSQLWRVAVPIPVTFAPPELLFKRLVFNPAPALAPAPHAAMAVFRTHIRPAVAKPATDLAVHRMTIPHPLAPIPVVAAVAPVAPAAAQAAPPPPAFAGPVESNYDVLER